MRWQSLPLVIGFVVLALIVGSRAVLVEGQRANRAAARVAIEYQELLSGRRETKIDVDKAGDVLLWFTIQHLQAVGTPSIA